MAERFQGAIFDVDGVLVDSPHEKAWREALRELMEAEWSDIRAQTTWSPEAFTSHVYQQVVSGKPRMSGARAVLDYFRVPDDAERTRAAEYGERKQTLVVRLIEAGDFTAYPDALRFIIAVKDAGLRVAAASSSKNEPVMLRQIRLDTFAREQGIASDTVLPGMTLLDYFDADVSGRDFAHGKPHPDMFLGGCRRAWHRSCERHRPRGRGSGGRGGESGRHGGDRHCSGGRRRSARAGWRRRCRHEPRSDRSKRPARGPAREAAYATGSSERGLNRSG